MSVSSPSRAKIVARIGVAQLNGYGGSYSLPAILPAPIGRELGLKPRMDLLPMQPGDVPATYADISRARTKLGFEPATPISKGIPSFIRWYRGYHGTPPS